MDTTKSKKKLVFLIITAAVILSMLGGVLYYIFKPDPPIDVTVINPEIKDVVESFETSAAVESESQGKFNLIEGVTVTNVSVKVGDVVKKGDLLAEFDSSTLSNALSQKKAALDKANKAYNDYLSGVSKAKGDISSYDIKIAQAQKTVDELEKEVKTQQNEAASSSQSAEAEKQLGELTEDKTLAQKIVSFFKGDDSALTRLINILDKLDSSSSVDLSSMMSFNMADSAQAKLIQAQLDLASLKITKTMLESQAQGSLSSVYKAIADYAAKSYNSAKQQIDSLKSGWKAEQDGIVSEVNIKPGESVSSESSTGFDISMLIDSVASGTADVSSILSSFTSQSKNAITVEYYPLEASFVIGQSDLANISVGQEAVVTSLSGNQLKGKVSYISAVANKTSGFDLSSLLDSSASSSVSGVNAKVQIEKPTKDVIIGLDVNISIEVNRSKNAVALPVESIQYDGDQPYVFIVKKEKKKFFIYKQNVEVGLFDGSFYEVVNGITADDEIVKSPTSTMQDGVRISPAIS
ncbi:MAG: biotin/lipoyl-binding protein [Clostridia bacterium]|nr:biotin/lipoyl-binding protein [Clostridia bacterium]